MKMRKLLLTIFPLIPLSYYSFLLFQQNLTTSYFFFAYNTIVIFSLPFLLAKVSGNNKNFYPHSMIFFLIYPMIYFLGFFLAKITTIDLAKLLSIISILLIYKWNVVLIYMIRKIKYDEVKRFLRHSIYLLPFLGIYLIIFSAIRHPNSIVALDYLQHYAVATEMNKGELFCLVPNQCSELFIQVGYTTVYHTVLGFLTKFSNTSPIHAIFMIDIIYPILIAILVFNFLKKFSKNLLFVSIMTLASILIFTNGSYETTFFLPQTFTFLFFLLALNIKKLNTKLLLPIGIIMILTHFIIGAYLFFLLLIKYLIVDIFSKKNIEVFYKYIFFFAILTPLILLLANSSGFTIETAFQGEATKMVGGLTNLPFPENIFKYLKIWGGAIMFLLFSIFFQKDKKNRWYIYSVTYLSITLCVFLLAPTYATKFLIGSGIFSIVLMLKYLDTLEEKSIKILASILILISLQPGYYFNKLDYLDFYRQSNNFASAVVAKDKDMLESLKNRETECIFVSDPLSQILIESLGEKQTARAQYIRPESRKEIFEFIQTPSEDTYQNLKNIEELKGREMCFVHSSRLNSSVQREETYWLSHMYSIIVDNSVKLDNIKEVSNFMREKGYKIIYRDLDFVVFAK
jgi:hypothetical protein